MTISLNPSVPALLPDFARLYAALVNRERSYDGRVFVAVLTTGIFCRLSCPARKPKAENCRFYGSVAACMEAGFRPCLRCKPLEQGLEIAPWVPRLLGLLENEPDKRWSEAALEALGLEPGLVRRKFQQLYGLSFLEMARLRRLREGFTRLQAGGKVIDAQLDAAFDSPAAFRTAFAQWIGLAPGYFRHDAPIKVDWLDTPLGAMLLVADTQQLHLLDFIDRKAMPQALRRLLIYAQRKGQALGFGRTPISEQGERELADYFAGQRAQFTLPLAYHGTEFSNRVWRALETIPAGETRSYKQLAEMIAQPSASRAVARANGANQISLVIPCHRVIGADGSLTGYGGGLWRKQQLLEIERAYR